MNLLQFKNRFKPSAFTPPNTDEIKGYMGALEDILSYLQDQTQFDPSKRMIDSVAFLNAIVDTNAELAKKISQINLNSPKVQQFLQEQINDPDDLKNVL